METIKTPDLTRLIAELRTRACINDGDAEAFEELLKAELTEYCLALDEYYLEEYSNALDNTQIIAYDEGNYDGYDDGYDAGYNAGYADGCVASH